MAYQKTAYPIVGADLPKKNDGVSDIAAGLGVTDDTNDESVKLPATSGGVVQPVGVTVETLKASGVGRVRTAGYAIMKASGTVNKGDSCKLDDASGKEGRPKATTNAGDWIIGIARSTAADGEDVVIDIRIFRY